MTRPSEQCSDARISFDTQRMKDGLFEPLCPDFMRNDLGATSSGR